MNATIEVEVGMTTKRILIVDDEVHVREVVQTCLETLGGWNVLSAASGREGLVRAEVEQPNAILLDVMMPGMDGFAFLRQLRANSATQDIPVVLLTAMAYRFNQQQLTELGVQTAIAKPFNPLLLIDEIALALGWSLEKPN
ncbi:response regulator [Trichocoleus sp. ST-U3]|nr:response regulator [Microcoleus sp. FACHB-SPT15]